jgi:hypothetical protein
MAPETVHGAGVKYPDTCTLVLHDYKLYICQVRVDCATAMNGSVEKVALVHDQSFECLSYRPSFGVDPEQYTTSYCR